MLNPLNELGGKCPHMQFLGRGQMSEGGKCPVPTMRLLEHRHVNKRSVTILLISTYMYRLSGSLFFLFYFDTHEIGWQATILLEKRSRWKTSLFLTAFWIYTSPEIDCLV